MKDNSQIKKYVMQKIFPLLAKSLLVRMAIKGRQAQERSYREGYWDGVADTLKVGLEKPALEKPTLH